MVIRGFLAGLISGGLLAAVLAAVASLTVPLPPGRGADVASPGASVPPVTEAPAPAPEAGVPADSEPADAEPADAEPAPDVAADPGQGGAILPEVAGLVDPTVPAPMAPPPDTGVAAPPAAPGPDHAPEAAALPPTPVAPPEPTPGAAALPMPQADLPQPPSAMAPLPDAAAVQPDQPATPGADTAQAAPSALPPLAPEPEDATEPQTGAVPAEPGLPQPGFGGAVEGVRTGRLPRIGDAPAGAVPAAPEAGADAEAIPDDAPALLRNARAFANPEAKPPMAILLLDDPASGVDLAALAAGPVALTLVIDPTAPDAAARAALWRAAGQEVALLADALPARGRGGDYEVAMESLTSAFPQALAVVETTGRPLPTDRAGSSALIAALAARGFGLITRGGGLNALDQTARRAGLPAAAIFRALDAENEAAPVILRYLDRAAFTAQQDGRVMVVGRLRRDTVAAVQDWASTSSRAAALALAPVSALVQAAGQPAP